MLKVAVLAEWQVNSAVIKRRDDQIREALPTPVDRDAPYPVCAQALPQEGGQTPQPGS